MKDEASNQSFKSLIKKVDDSRMREIAVAYATQDDILSIKKLSEYYNLTEYATRQLIDYTIVHCIVSYQISLLIRDKAHRNQAKYYKHSGQTTSDKYYDTIFDKRLSFIRYEMKNDVIKNIVDVYISSKDLPAATLSNMLGFSIDELNLILEKAIIFNIVDDITVRKLFETSLCKVSSAKKRESMEKNHCSIKKMRNECIAIVSEMALISKQIDEYGDIASSEDELNQSIDSLNSRLKKLEEAYNSLLILY